MGFFRQFDLFDPVTGGFPWPSFSAMQAIADRARRLLKGRTREQIISGAKTADWFIETYFETQREDYINRTLERPDPVWGLLPNQQRNESGLRDLLQDWPSSARDYYPDFPTPENTSDLEALRESIDWFELDQQEDFPSPAQHEYFAILALWRLADAGEWLSQTRRPKTVSAELNTIIEALPAYATVEDPATRYSLAGDCALEAMDAVCWAEHLLVEQRLKGEIGSLQVRLNRLEETTNEQIHSLAREKISVAASRAAIKRHSENRAMKAEVFAWCANNLGDYPSMDKAAEAIAGKLVPVSFRTARDWIAQWRNTTRSARRP